MKKNILVVFSLLIFVGMFLSLCSCGEKSIFGKYLNEDKYYILNEDYTWESYDDSGTFTYDEENSIIYFVTKNEKSFNCTIKNYKELYFKEFDSELEIYVIVVYSK